MGTGAGISITMEYGMDKKQMLVSATYLFPYRYCQGNEDDCIYPESRLDSVMSYMYTRHYIIRKIKIPFTPTCR
jgi:hypothetical protein